MIPDGKAAGGDDPQDKLQLIHLNVSLFCNSFNNNVSKSDHITLDG
jgi:hypothetical protein